MTSTPKAQTAAERQAAFRERHKQGGGGRINYAVSAHAEAALKRLATHYGVTNKGMLEKLITEAESALLDSMKPAEQKKYRNE